HFFADCPTLPGMKARLVRSLMSVLRVWPLLVLVALMLTARFWCGFWQAQGVAALVALTLLASIVGTIYARGGLRIFCAAFSATGWLIVLLGQTVPFQPLRNLLNGSICPWQINWYDERNGAEEFSIQQPVVIGIPETNDAGTTSLKNQVQYKEVMITL